MKWLCTFILCFSFNVYGYSVVDRFKLINDELMVSDLINKVGHDFFIRADVTINKDLPNVIEDVSNVSKFPSAERLGEAQKFFIKYDKTEQFLRANVGLGIPFFKFNFGELRLQTNIRATANLGANIGIRSEKLNIQNIYDLFGIELPSDLKSFIANEPVGNDIVADCIASGTLSESTRNICSQLPTGKFKMPNLTTQVPNVALYTKLDMKFGFFNDYTYSDYIHGSFNFYALDRTDIYQRLTQDMISSGSKIDFPDNENTEVSLQSDFKIGLYDKESKISASLEELLLAKTNERAPNSKESSYGYNPLFRLHAEHSYKEDAFSIMPYIGVHKRSGYKLSDGLYLGAKLGLMAFEETLAVQINGMVNRQYFTFSPQIKIWLLQIEYSLNYPLRSTFEQIKVSPLQSLSLKILI